MRSESPSSAGLIVAFAMIYLVWGSTYLAIAIAIQSIPPFLTIGTRFLFAGSVLYAFLRIKGNKRPAAQEIINASFIGFLTLGLGTGLVAWAEQFISSGVAALIITAVPLWLVLLDWLMLKGGRPNVQVVVGLVLGVAGIVLLVGEDVVRMLGNAHPEGGKTGLAMLLVLVATLTWSIGSLRSKMIRMPENLFMSSSIQMGIGGLIVTLIGLAIGEGHQMSVQEITAESIWAWVYLVVFGSFGAFSAYVWLLAHAPPKQISSYAFVNPVVAVLLGWWLIDEVVTVRMVWAIVILVSAVALIVVYGGRKKSAEGDIRDLETQ